MKRRYEMASTQDLDQHSVMLAKGWQYIGAFERKNAPARLQSHFIANGCEVRETDFTDRGYLVHKHSFALWVNPCGLAPCGCVEHAEEGWPCEHDLMAFEELKKKVLG
ncbi:MAG TPA: hypothetical protein PLZ99_03100 [Parcubacteria group bacterium]|nr:hypothetical protein [Parcubacteria group bacterium]